jgi:hypothetical protein
MFLFSFRCASDIYTVEHSRFYWFIFHKLKRSCS